MVLKIDEETETCMHNALNAVKVGSDLVIEWMFWEMNGE